MQSVGFSCFFRGISKDFSWSEVVVADVVIFSMLLVLLCTKGWSVEILGMRFSCNLCWIEAGVAECNGIEKRVGLFGFDN